MADQWESILAEKDFQSLPPKDKAIVANNFFRANIATETDYQGLAPEQQAKVRTNFLSTIQEKDTFESEHPIINAALKTIKSVPRTIIAGATLGLSEKIREAVGDPEPYSSIPDGFGKTAGEFAGAALPIAKIGQGINIATKLVKPALGAAGASKYFNPVAKSVSWAMAGAGYEATKGVINKGELPTAKELGTDAAMWGGTEAIINSLGWGGRMGAAIVRLSKAYGIPKKDVLKSVFNQAKETGSPIVEIASQRQAAQEALATIEAARESGESLSRDTPAGMISEAAEKFVRKVESLVEAQRTKHQRGYEALRRDLSIDESGVGLDFQSMSLKDRMEATVRKSSLSGTPEHLAHPKPENFMAPEYNQRIPNDQSGAFKYANHIPETSQKASGAGIDSTLPGTRRTEDFKTLTPDDRIKAAMRDQGLVERAPEIVQPVTAAKAETVEPVAAKPLEETVQGDSGKQFYIKARQPLNIKTTEDLLTAYKNGEIDYILKSGDRKKYTDLPNPERIDKNIREMVKKITVNSKGDFAVILEDGNKAKFSISDDPNIISGEGIHKLTDKRSNKEYVLSPGPITGNIRKLLKLDSHFGENPTFTIADVDGMVMLEHRTSGRYQRFYPGEFSKVLEAKIESGDIKPGDRITLSEGFIKNKHIETYMTEGDIGGPTLYSVNPAGALAGINTDEQGTIQYDPMLGMVGMAAGALLIGGGMRSLRKSKKYADAKQNPSDAERVTGMYERTEDAIRKKYAVTAAKVKDRILRSFVDVSWKVKSMAKSVDPVLGREIEMTKNAIAGASHKAAQRFDNFHDQIYRGLTRTEEKMLDRIVNARRNIEISGYKPGHKHQEGLEAQQFQSLLDDIKSGGPSAEGLHPKQIEEIFKRSEAVFSAHASNTQRLLEGGVVSGEEYENLVKNIYSPRKYLDHLDELDKGISGRSITSGDTGIKALEDGSIGLMEIRSRLLLQQSVARVEDLVARNKANLKLLEMADLKPDNAIIRRAEIIRTTKDGKPVYQEAGTGEAKIAVRENGQRVEMIVPKEFERSWVKTDPLINTGLATALQWMSMSKPLKMTATGINPAFAFTNMPRDITLVWTGGQYSRTLPIAAAEFAKDFAKTAKDTFTRSGRAIDYVNEGGGMELLTYYGRGGHMSAGLKDSLNDAGKMLGWVGETSEIWTRLAHRERALTNLTKDFKAKNGRAPDATELKALQFEASQIAREGGIDFAQGGNVIKALDNIIPYLNVAIQGTRTLGKNFKASPWGVTYQIAQLGTIAGMLYSWNQHNPEAWKQVSDRDKSANFILIVPDLVPGVTSYTDDKGQKRYRYIKIAKEQSIRPFTSAIDAAMEFSETGVVPKKQIFQALSDLGLPYHVPVLSALTAIAGNVDDYEWERIWKGSRDIEPKEEYRNDTAKGFVALGEATGLSPVRMQAALNKITPLSNPLVGAIGTAMQVATGEQGTELQNKGWNQFISENRSVRRILSSTSPAAAYRDNIQEAKTASNTESIKQNRELERLTDAFFKTGDQADGQKVQAYIEAQPEKDQERLVKRYTDAYELKDIPDRGFWLSIKAAPPEARAKILVDRITAAKPEERQSIIDTANSIHGVVTERVLDEFTKLIDKPKKKKMWGNNE